MKSVELRLLAGLRANLPVKDRQKGSTVVEVRDDVTLAELLELSGIDSGRTLVVLVNGRYAAPDRVCEAGDIVSVFPPVAGG